LVDLLKSRYAEEIKKDFLKGKSVNNKTSQNFQILDLVCLFLPLILPFLFWLFCKNSRGGAGIVTLKHKSVWAETDVAVHRRLAVFAVLCVVGAGGDSVGVVEVQLGVHADLSSRCSAKLFVRFDFFPILEILEG
jgi:hypothetical protein